MHINRELNSITLATKTCFIFSKYIYRSLHVLQILLQSNISIYSAFCSNSA